MERVPQIELREQGKVAVSGEQEFNAVGKADRSNSSVVNDGAPHSRALHQAAQDPDKIVGLTEQAISW